MTSTLTHDHLLWLKRSFTIFLDRSLELTASFVEKTVILVEKTATFVEITVIMVEIAAILVDIWVNGTV